jgi:hypothetical protein
MSATARDLPGCAMATFPGRRGASSSRTHREPRAPHANEGGRRNASPVASLVMPTDFVAQNGAEIHRNTPISITGGPNIAKRTKPRRPATVGRMPRAGAGNDVA